MEKERKEILEKAVSKLRDSERVNKVTLKVSNTDYLRLKNRIPALWLVHNAENEKKALTGTFDVLQSAKKDILKASLEDIFLDALRMRIIKHRDKYRDSMLETLGLKTASLTRRVAQTFKKLSPEQQAELLKRLGIE